MLPTNGTENENNAPARKSGGDSRKSPSAGSLSESTVDQALGVKVWTMLPTTPDWRWGLEGDTTRWYPTMRLFRQEQMGNWQPVISRVAQELTSFINPDER